MRSVQTVDGIDARLHDAARGGARALAARRRASTWRTWRSASASASALGLDAATDRARPRGVRGVPGRLERVENERGFGVFVDYAHTPDALERAIAALRPLTRGRLIVVFGCGGDRDRSKRPKMGRAVARDADLPIVTTDNPRTEEPEAIVEHDRGRRARAAVRDGVPSSRSTGGGRSAAAIERGAAGATWCSSPARGTRTTRSSARRSTTSTTAKRRGRRSRN